MSTTGAVRLNPALVVLVTFGVGPCIEVIPGIELEGDEFTVFVLLVVTVVFFLSA